MVRQEDARAAADRPHLERSAAAFRRRPGGSDEQRSPAVTRAAGASGGGGRRGGARYEYPRSPPLPMNLSRASSRGCASMNP